MKISTFLIVLVWMLAFCPGILTAQENDLAPGEWRENEIIGLGFGPVLSFGLGVQGYLDYNLDAEKLLHLLVSSEVRERENIFGFALLQSLFRYICNGFSDSQMIDGSII